MAFTHETGWSVTDTVGNVWDWRNTEAAALTAADALVFDNPDTDTFYVAPATRVRQV